MVRTYKPKNLYRKWSKLSQEQTTYLLRIYFISADLKFIAGQAGISLRTARMEFRRINDFLLTHAPCREAIVAYLSPEIAGAARLLAQTDFSEASDFWDRIHTCFFECPAQRDVSLQLTSVSYLAGLRHVQEMRARNGTITMVRNACAACPARHIRASIDVEMLAGVKTFLEVERHRSRREVRERFFQAVCRVGIRLRAGAVKLEASPEEGDNAFWRAVNKSASDLATITAYHMALETRQRWVPDVSGIRGSEE